MIAAVGNDAQLDRAIRSPSKVIFLLYGDVCSIGELVDRIKREGGDRLVFVHIDLVSGLAHSEVSVDYIKNSTEADGVISTRPKMIKRAKKLGLLTVLRIFLLDSRSLSNIDKQISEALPDSVEILPALMHKITEQVCGMVSIPVVVGGLLTDRAEVSAALAAGAVSASTTCEDIWYM